MTRLTDGKKTIEIVMKVWEGHDYSPEWDYDFFETGRLPRDEQKDAYIVPNVDYCVEQAEDWKYGRGDFLDDYEGTPGHNPDDRYVDVAEV